jgi:hypothetical protein
VKRILVGIRAILHFNSLSNADGLPILNVQIIKSKDFMKAHCFDKKFEIISQLDNGKLSH